MQSYTIMTLKAAFPAFLAMLSYALSTNASLSQVVPGISDITISFEKPYRLDFDCPSGSSTGGGQNTCWAEFQENSIDIMGLQQISREDVIGHWYVTTRDWGGCNYSSWNFLYKTVDGVRRNLVMRKKDCGWKNKKVGETESLYVNNWLFR